MLSVLRISNFAVIEEVEVAFGPGLTVLTGETGAGKSILVDALGLLMGGRADAEVAGESLAKSLIERTEQCSALLAENANLRRVNVGYSKDLKACDEKLRENALKVLEHDIALKNLEAAIREMRGEHRAIML